MIFSSKPLKRKVISQCNISNTSSIDKKLSRKSSVSIDNSNLEEILRNLENLSEHISFSNNCVDETFDSSIFLDDEMKEAVNEKHLIYLNEYENKTQDKELNDSPLDFSKLGYLNEEYNTVSSTTKIKNEDVDINKTLSLETHKKEISWRENFEHLYAVLMDNLNMKISLEYRSTYCSRIIDIKNTTMIFDKCEKKIFKTVKISEPIEVILKTIIESLKVKEHRYFLQFLDKKFEFYKINSHCYDFVNSISDKEILVLMYKEFKKMYFHVSDFPCLITLGRFLKIKNNCGSILIYFHLINLLLADKKIQARNKKKLLLVLIQKIYSFDSRYKNINIETFVLWKQNNDVIKKKCNKNHYELFKVLVWELNYAIRNDISTYDKDRDVIIYSINTVVLKHFEFIMKEYLLQYMILKIYFDVCRSQTKILEELIKESFEEKTCFGCRFEKFLKLIKKL
jgi:hypothetical protein